MSDIHPDNNKMVGIWPCWNSDFLICPLYAKNKWYTLSPRNYGILWNIELGNKLLPRWYAFENLSGILEHLNLVASEGQRNGHSIFIYDKECLVSRVVFDSWNKVEDDIKWCLAGLVPRNKLVQKWTKYKSQYGDVRLNKRIGIIKEGEEYIWLEVPVNNS
jgi:hypothetical protein